MWNASIKGMIGFLGRGAGHVHTSAVFGVPGFSHRKWFVSSVITSLTMWSSHARFTVPCWMWLLVWNFNVPCFSERNDQFFDFQWKRREAEAGWEGGDGEFITQKRAHDVKFMPKSPHCFAVAVIMNTVLCSSQDSVYGLHRTILSVFTLLLSWFVVNEADKLPTCQNGSLFNDFVFPEISGRAERLCAEVFRWAG